MFDGIRNPKVEHQDYVSGEVTTWYMTEEQMKEKWGERLEATEENYNTLKEKGLLDKDIAERFAIKPPILSQKKKQWREERWAREDAEKEDPVAEKVDEREVESVDETAEGSTDDTDWVQRYEDMKKERDEWMEKHESTVQDYDLLNQEFSDMEVRALQAEDELERYKEAAEGQTEVFNRTGQAYKELEKERDEWKREAEAKDKLYTDALTDYALVAEERKKELTFRQALEEKVEYYENGNASRMQKENDNFRQIIRSMAEVI
ncbi:hypothetical protein [Salibacterium lacus]|uniref:Uncharacterized protein n=1 Tax=Salibacterium lacus TaxID=1898109 RepID=A0ABW5SWX0_9BACI